MTQLEWDKVGERFFRTGVSHGVLYIPNNKGLYLNGFAWNGLVSVTYSPSGAEANKQYADNIVYANIKSAEEVGGTIEAFTSPKEFAECDGTRMPVPGLYIGQQRRKSFGFSWQTLLGNDLEGTDYGYEINIVYGADANPSEIQDQTVNDSPEPATLSWEFTTTPVAVPGLKPTAKITIKSTDLDEAKLAELEAILYGTAGSNPRLPMPAELIELLTNGTTEVNPTKPVQTGNDVAIPNTTGVTYSANGEDLEVGTFTLTEDTIIAARPKQGYRFPAVVDTDWLYETV